MSRRNGHPDKRPTNLALPFIVFGAVLIAGAVLLLSRPGGAAHSEIGGAAQIAVDQQKIDYGYVKFGETRQFKIAVTNNGTGPLRFKSKPYIEVLEGC